MSSAQGARVSAFCENGFGEPEQDANSALTELDKGLRSSHAGEQCEAIVGFPALFEKYPFPILINSAMLKLAEVFRIGTNFLRLWILRVCHESERHLDKILNVDEFVRRIFSVIHSNDPVARALTLRTLGSIAVIIPENKQVHHSIHNSLDSSDRVEVLAAIYAAGRFAAQSKTFSMNMCSKVADMIQGLATPVELKVRLIPILQHMHHDAQTATTVRSLCMSLLLSYPAQDFVVVTLHTLTQLSAATLVDIPLQVHLLIQYMTGDARQAVKELTLKDLLLLANKAAHLWKPNQVEQVAEVALASENDTLVIRALTVLHSLAKSSAVSEFDFTPDSPVLTLCQRRCYCENIDVAAKAVQLISCLAAYCKPQVPEAVMAIESLVTISVSVSPVHLFATKVGLSCAVGLCHTNPEVSSQFVDSIGGMLKEAQGQTRVLLCEALGAIGDMQRGSLVDLLPDLGAPLATLNHSNEVDSLTAVMLATLMFQTVHPNNEEVEKRVSEAVDSLDLWSVYRIGRAAARYGHHRMAAKVFGRLVGQVASESFSFWLEALKQVCLGEAALSPERNMGLVPRLNKAIDFYMRGTSTLKAASTPATSLQFHHEYSRLRGELLQAMLQIIHMCRSIRTSPPPAVAASLSLEDPQRCGRITYQVRRCIKELHTVADMYGKLHHSAFDADPDTLLNIQLMQQICLYLGQSMENSLLKSQSGLGTDEDMIGDFEFGFSLTSHKCNIATQGLVDACQKSAAILKQLNSHQDLKPIDLLPKFVSCLQEAVTVLIETPLTFPRLYFQTLQTTSIKLAITPQPRVPGEAVTVQPANQLAVKLEGVIQHGKLPIRFRSVKKVLLTVTTQLQSRAQHATDTKIPENGTVLSQSVEPHNDFFTAQFLLAFPIAGLHVLSIEASMVDSGDMVWHTGPRNTLSVKAYDEGSSKGAQAAAAAAAAAAAVQQARQGYSGRV